MTAAVAPPAPSPDVRRGRAPKPKWLRGVALLIGVLSVVLAAAFGIRLGAVDLSWGEVWHGLAHYGHSNSDIIVRDVRLPSVLIAVEVGAALAVAGALMQGLTRNPLADPGILGINAGAAFVVVLGFSLGWVSQLVDFVWLAIPGAALGVALGSLVALVGRGKTTPLKLTLGGVIAALVLGSATTLIVTVNPDLSDQVAYWTIGEVNDRPLAVFDATWPFILVGLLIALPMGRALNGLSLGEDLARSLGQHIELTRTAVIVATVLLAGGAVGAAGPVAFVGLAAPTVVRSLVGNDYRWILPLAAVYGATFLLLASIVGRVLIKPQTIQTGLVVSVVGIAIFLAAVCRRQGVNPL